MEDKGFTTEELGISYILTRGMIGQHLKIANGNSCKKRPNEKQQYI